MCESVTGTSRWALSAQGTQHQLPGTTSIPHSARAALLELGDSRLVHSFMSCHTHWHHAK